MFQNTSFPVQAGVARRGVAALAIGAALAVSGCANRPVSQQTIGAGAGAVGGALIGSTIGAGSGRTAAIIVGGLIGALVGSEIGRVMDENDQLRAAHTTNEALENGVSGQDYGWCNPDSGACGEVTPGRAYRQSGEICRDYTHTVRIDGRSETMTGTACRQPDGSWRAIS